MGDNEGYVYISIGSFFSYNWLILIILLYSYFNYSNIIFKIVQHF